VLENIILNDAEVSAPLEYVEYLYKKEFGLTTEEFLSEPMDRIGMFIEIKKLENLRQEVENNKSERRMRNG